MKILTLGIYRTDVPSLRDSIQRNLDRSKAHSNLQIWAPASAPKFTMLNTLVKEHMEKADPDYLLLVDDDIRLPDDFLDRFIWYVWSRAFHLSQPARTANSTIHHPIVLRDTQAVARRTLFVEIGPVVCVERVLFKHLLPFDETSPMGWGYDYAWPAIVEKLKLRMGIIDATPVEHAFRPNISYDTTEVSNQMHEYLKKHEHFAPEVCYRELQRYRA